MCDAADRIGCRVQFNSNAYEKSNFLFKSAANFIHLRSTDVGYLFCWHVFNPFHVLTFVMSVILMIAIYKEKVGNY